MKGNFEQLEQFIGIPVTKESLNDIVDLFYYTDMEIGQLQNLNGAGGRNTLAQKKYRHLCYIFECAYALAIETNKNISSNPGFEWQLGYYGTR